MKRNRLRADITLTADEQAAFKQMHDRVGGRYFSFLIRQAIRVLIFIERAKTIEGARVEIVYPDGSRQRLEVIA